MKFRHLTFLVITLALCQSAVSAQNPTDKPRPDADRSIGGKEHESNILGVTIGMDVPTALRTVFVNAGRKPGQEKPDAKRSEGKDGKDVRVVYKGLAVGELQILFAGGKFVKEVTLKYAKPPQIDDLRLPETGSLGNSTSLITTSSVERDGPPSTRTDALDGTREISGFNAANVSNIDRRRGEALDGTRLDDRYSVAFADGLKQQRIWWRSEASALGFKVVVQFVSEKRTKAGADFVGRVEQKTVMVKPEDEADFRKAVGL